MNYVTLNNKPLYGRDDKFPEKIVGSLWESIDIHNGEFDTLNSLRGDDSDQDGICDDVLSLFGHGQSRFPVHKKSSA